MKKNKFATKFFNNLKPSQDPVKEYLIKFLLGERSNELKIKLIKKTLKEFGYTISVEGFKLLSKMVDYKIKSSDLVFLVDLDSGYDSSLKRIKDIQKVFGTKMTKLTFPGFL